MFEIERKKALNLRIGFLQNNELGVESFLALGHQGQKIRKKCERSVVGGQLVVIFFTEFILWC